jgi:hypothetical protein
MNVKLFHYGYRRDVHLSAAVAVGRTPLLRFMWNHFNSVYSPAQHNPQIGIMRTALILAYWIVLVGAPNLEYTHINIIIVHSTNYR